MEENKYILTFEVTIFTTDSDKAIEKATKLQNSINDKNRVDCSLVSIVEKSFNRTINIDIDNLDL
jgi:hypothetical protein